MNRAHKIFLLTALMAMTSIAPAQPIPRQEPLYAIFSEMIATRTVYPEGDNTALVNNAAARLRTAGFNESDISVIVPPGGAKKGNLIASLKGTG